MTKMKTPLAFRVASTPEEFAQIYRLNHQTFAEEIPQHAPNEDGLLRDQFDAENTYVVAVRDDRVVGMIAVRGRRPFSLDAKLPNLDAYLPPAPAACEVRLLAVERAHRTGVVFRGLVAQLADVCLERGYDLALISGTTRQLRLYRHLGFVPFGPLVGPPEAQYQPMYLTVDGFRRHERTFAQRAAPPPPDVTRGASACPPSNFLPGPINIPPRVRAALMEPPVSHRGWPFMDTLACTRKRLCKLANASDVQILLGSGTLANDVVGGQLRLLDQPGLVLVNGEFGERLVDHAGRLGLSFRVHRVPWGEPFDWSRVAAKLAGSPEAGWLWAVHCETSTGIVNRLDALREVSRRHGVRLALDAVSSLGSIPVDLRGVHLASSTSGKGLGSFAGLALVFHAAPPRASPEKLPRYLDLGLYAAGEGVAFTQSSNLVHALHAALDRPDWNAWFAQVQRDGLRLRHRLRTAGLDVLVTDMDVSPAVTTIALPSPAAAERVGVEMEKAGFHLSYQSAYLLRRDWVQVCLMGDYPRDQLAPLVDRLASIDTTASAPNTRPVRSSKSSISPLARLRTENPNGL